jgi:hypothetical protein
MNRRVTHAAVALAMLGLVGVPAGPSAGAALSSATQLRLLPGERAASEDISFRIPSNLVPLLERAAGKHFGSVWVDTATNSFHVGIATDPQGLIRVPVETVIRGLPDDVRSRVVIEAVPFSRSQLVNLVASVRAAIPADVPAIIGVSTGGKLGVTVPIDSSVEATIRRIVPPEVLDMHFVDRTMFMGLHANREQYPTFEAGLRISMIWGAGCTSGPLYANGYGTFATTDGHCGGIQINSRNGTKMGPVAANVWNTAGNGGVIPADVLSASTNTNVTDDLYLGSGSHRDVDAEIPNAYQYDGVQVWVSRGQADVVDTANIYCAAPCTFTTIGPLDGTARTITNGACANITGIGGDSGSPVYRPNGANAAIAGLLSNAAGCYSTSSGVSAALGAVLVTWL